MALETVTSITPDAAIPEIEPDEPVVTESPSISDHAAKFGPGAKQDPEPETKADDLKPIRPVDQQKREQGKFAEGKRPMKASEAVKRINELTGRAKTAEERATSAEGRLQAAERELATLKAQGGTKAEIKQAEQKVERAEAKVESIPSTFKEPEPVEDDPKFAGDYGKYIRALAAWEGRKAYHDEKAAERAEQQKAQREASEREVVKTWAGRVEATKAKYQDFEQVALGPTRIPMGSAIDAFIMEDEHGPDVLYHLNKHPEELDTLLAMSSLGQIKGLALLSQRLVSTPPGTTGATGSVAERKVVVLPPRPPNPVRTEAQRTKDDPPPTDGSLSIAEHRKHFGPKR